MRGFSNQTIAPVVPTKPHICKRAGYWRVSPWFQGSGSLFYHAHGWVNQRNYREGCEQDRIEEAKAGVAKGSYQVCDDPIQANRDRNLDKKLRHAMHYNVGPGAILGIIEQHVL